MIIAGKACALNAARELDVTDVVVPPEVRLVKFTARSLARSPPF